MTRVIALKQVSSSQHWLAVAGVKHLKTKSEKKPTKNPNTKNKPKMKSVGDRLETEDKLPLNLIISLTWEKHCQFYFDPVPVFPQTSIFNFVFFSYNPYTF